MFRSDEILPSAIALLVGVTLAFILIAALTFLVGAESRLFLPTLVAAYAFSGAVLGFLWPRVGWRLGAWLFAIWPPMLLFGLFLSGDVLLEGQVQLKGMSRDLLGYLLIFVFACLGAEIGAIIKRGRLPSSSATH